MTNDQIVIDAEVEIKELAAELIEIRPGECLLCYVWRMLEFGCVGLRWAKRYRDIRAPRARALERRLGQRGGFCDCEIFMNAYQPAPHLWIVPEPVDDEDVDWEDDASPPEEMPPCEGAAPGSTKPCGLWTPHRRW